MKEVCQVFLGDQRKGFKGKPRGRVIRWREPVENEKGITQISSMLKEHNESYGSKTFDDKMIW